MTEEYTSAITRRSKAAFKLGAIVLGVSTFAYYITGCICGMNAGYGKNLWSLNDDRWELSECLYFSSITLTTTGYGDLLGTEKCELWKDGNGNFRWESGTDPHTSCKDEEEEYDRDSEHLVRNFSPYTRSLTAFIGIIGMAFFLFVIAQVTAFFVEGGYEAMALNIRRKKQLKRMQDHVIVCGGGQEGSHAVQHIQKSGIDCAVIDSDESAIKRLQKEHNNVLCLCGDATLEETLIAAGLDRARAVISALPDDGLNLVTVVTIRQHRADVRVVSRAVNEESAIRLKLAGADDVVDSSRLMGLRLASQLIRPTAVDFLDHVLGHRGGQDLQLVRISLTDDFVSRSLNDLPIADTAHTQIVALRHEDGTFSYNPTPTESISKGDDLLVVGLRQSNSHLAEKLGSTALHDDPPSKGKDSVRTERSRSSEQTLDVDSGYYVICGANDMSAHIARELGTSGRSCCIIDQDLDLIRDLEQEYASVRTVRGDARSLDGLRKAEIGRARGLVTTFRSDQDNLIIVVTALQTQSELRVVSLASDDSSARRLEHAGAVVRQSGQIGGRRLASQLLKTAVTSLLDRMLDESGAIRFEGIAVQEDSPNANKSLGEVDIFGQTGLRILALRRPNESSFIVAPKPNEPLHAGTILVVAGAARQVDRLANLVGAWK